MPYIYCGFHRFPVLCDTSLFRRSESYRVAEGWPGTYGYVLAWQYHLPSLPRRGTIRILRGLYPNSRPVYPADRLRTSETCVVPFHGLFLLRGVLWQQGLPCLQSFLPPLDVLPGSKPKLHRQPGLRHPLLRCYPTLFWSVLRTVVRQL